MPVALRLFVLRLAASIFSSPSAPPSRTLSAPENLSNVPLTGRIPQKVRTAKPISLPAGSTCQVPLVNSTAACEAVASAMYVAPL